MPYSRVSAYGVSNGNVTDAEKMAQQQRQQDMQAQAAMAEVQARERMHGKSDATQRYGVDQQTAVAGTFGQRAGQESAMFDKKAGHDVTLGGMDTERQMGVTGLQMKPATMDAELRQKQYGDQSWLDGLIKDKVMSRLGGQAPAGGAPAGAPAPGNGAMGDGDLQMFSVLAALKGGQAMPDFQQQAVQRQVQSMQMEDLNRNRAKGRAEEYRAAGNEDLAKSTAAAGGIALPRVAAADMASSPEYTQKFDRAASRTQGVLGDVEAGDDEVAQVKSMVDEAIASLVARGVDQQEAQAYVLQEFEKKLPERSGTIGKIANIMNPLGVLMGTTFRPERVDKLRDSIGY